MTMLAITTSAQPAKVVGRDMAFYARYPYLQLSDGSIRTELTDDEFLDQCAKVIFPVNIFELPKHDDLLKELEEVVIPRLNADSLTLQHILIRGAASPEGPFVFNKMLGENRGKALFDFINSRLAFPVDDSHFSMQVEIEDYRLLCALMRRAGDSDYPVVKEICDYYLSYGNYADLKQQLKKVQGGRLWQRLLKEYYPNLRAARVIIYLQDARNLQDLPEPVSVADGNPVAPELHTVIDLSNYIFPLQLAGPRRELLAVKSNLLLDVAYMPGYDRWCPIPNVAVEYYPKHGHFTFGASFDFPWWRDYWGHKYFQVRNYQLETRYYFRSGDIALNPPGQGAAFRGFYLQGYVHAGLFGICFDADRGWVGEGMGAGIGAGYVMPLTQDGHWRLEFSAQLGYFVCKYDPYQFENPVDPNYRDHLYYYKWTLDPSLFKKRQYRFNWLGPTRIGVTLSYDLLYRRNQKKGISFNKTGP